MGRALFAEATVPESGEDPESVQAVEITRDARRLLTMLGFFYPLSADAVPHISCTREFVLAISSVGSDTILRGFTNCPCLQEVLFAPDSLLSEMGGLQDCPFLSRIENPKSITKLDDNAFAQCQLLEDITRFQMRRSGKSTVLSIAYDFIG
jgi:hypothetical protein